MARAAAATAATPLPFDVRLALVGANVLLTLLGVVIVAGAMWWVATRPAFTLRGITLEGDLTHNTPLTVRAAVNNKLAGNFLSLDLEHAREAFESVPWVRHATVRRVFPDRLAVRLKALVEAGVLEKREYQQNPVRHDYHLTAAGRDLAPVLHALLDWGDRWAVDEPPITLKHHGHRLRSRTVCATCGETVHQRDLVRESNIPAWSLEGPVPV